MCNGCWGFADSFGRRGGGGGFGLKKGGRQVWCVCVVVSRDRGGGGIGCRIWERRGGGMIGCWD